MKTGVVDGIDSSDLLTCLLTYLLTYLHTYLLTYTQRERDICIAISQFPWNLVKFTWFLVVPGGGGFSLFAFAGWWVGLIDWFDWFGWPIKWLVK